MAEQVLLGESAVRLLRGFRVPRSWQGAPEQALVASRKVGFPLVVKIVSEQLIHKTEVGAVKTVGDESGLRQVIHDFHRIARKQRLKSYALQIQQFIKGVELIAGIKYDATFGHVVLVGLGGVFVEVLKDVSFRVCPVTSREVNKMLAELKAKTLLDGVRGFPKVNVRSLVRDVVRLSQLPQQFPTIKELDINPLIVNDKGAFVVDVRVVVN